MYKLIVTLVCLTWLCGSVAAASKVTIQVKGADTMIHLAESWADKFMQINPDIKVVVTGGGSKPGIEALISGAIDIADTARPIEKAEIQTAKSKGFDLVEHIVALDGITMIVNRSAPVYSLTLPQLKQIFTGEVDNWKKFGGPDQKIHLYIRDADSGIYVFFQKKILNKETYSPHARRLTSNAAIVHEVSDDEAGIGYVGFGYYSNAKIEVRALRIQKNDKSPDITPSIETVTDESYPISHKLRMVTKGQATGPVKQFIDFVIGYLGQDIVEYQGCVKLPKQRSEK